VKALVLNRVALVLSFAGIYISGVLSIGAHFAMSIPCGESHGCDIVARHPSSHALGIPNAYIGLIAYVILAIFSYLRLVAPIQAYKTLPIGYALTAIGTLGSLALTYEAIAVIHATCIWCLSSTATMILLLIVHSLLMQVGSPTEVKPPLESDEPAAAPREQSNTVNVVMLAVLLLASVFALGVEWAKIVDEKNGHLEQGANRDPKVIMPTDVHIYGDPAAPMTIVEFGDLLCPLCKDEFPKIQQFVADHKGQVKYVFRHYPVMNAPGHEQSASAAIASEILAEKGDFWPFVTLMYTKDHAEFKDINPLLDIVQGFGVDSDKVLARIKDGKDKAFQRVVKDMTDAGKLGVHGTPTYFILAPGVLPRAMSGETIFEDLARDEYKKFLTVGTK
jgi:protein-disulfide isomerase